MMTNSIAPRKSDVCVICFNYTNTVVNKGHYFIPAKCFLMVAGIWKVKQLKSK